MRKILCAVLLVCTVVSCAWADVVINDENFHDDNFRAFMYDLDKNEDGILSDSELAAQKNLSLRGENIQSLKGIEYFTNLVSLDCSYNPISELNLSANTALTYLYCSHNTELISLDCQSTDIVAIDVSGNTALEYLYAKNARLTAIDLTSNTALKSINFESCQLTEIDLSKNTALQNIALAGNQLAALDLSNNMLLEQLTCGGNNIEELDLSNHTELMYVACEGNQLTKLDVSGCTELQMLFCWRNMLTELDLSDNSNLLILRCESNQLTTLDLSQNTALDMAYAHYVQGNELYLSINLQRIPSIDVTIQEGKYEYPYALDLKKYMNASDLPNVIASSIKAVDEDNEEVGTKYSSNGIIEFEASPARVSYRYMTGFKDLSMDVKIGDLNYLTVALKGHIYRLFTKRYTWLDAKEYCESVGGHLITITSSDEFIVAANLIHKAVKEGDVAYTGEASVWTGGVLSGDSWRWVTGEGLNLRVHSLTENAAYLDMAVILSGDTVYNVNFNGMSRRYLMSFICEWEPTEIEIAPVNPEYEEWRKDPNKYLEGYENYGVIPSPLDLSHLTKAEARDVTASIPVSFDPRGSDFIPNQPAPTIWMRRSPIISRRSILR